MSVFYCRRFVEAQVSLITLMMALFYLCVPITYNCLTVKQQAQWQNTETEVVKCSLSMINFITLFFNTCAFLL